MVRDGDYLRRWELAQLRLRTATLDETLRRVDELRLLAIDLGVWPPADPLAGVEQHTEFARALQHARTPRPPGPRPG